MWVIKMNIGFSLQLLHKCFTTWIQQVVGVDNVEDEEEYNQFDEVSFFVDTTRINIVETKISYNNVISYVRTDGE
jgi:hypothetical protein